MEANVTSRDVLSRVTKLHAEILIVAGLVFVLVAPLIPVFKTAKFARAQFELSQADTLMQLDLDDLKRTQERERKEDVDAATRESAVPINYSAGPEQVQKQQQDRAAAQETRREKELQRQKALEDKTDELQHKYDSTGLRRALIEAQAGATGMRWHVALTVIGNLALLIGLLVWTLGADGMRQKIAFVVLIVVLLGALSNFSVNLGLGAHSAGVEHLSP